MRNRVPGDLTELEAIEAREWLDSLDDVLQTSSSRDDQLKSLTLGGHDPRDGQIDTKIVQKAIKDARDRSGEEKSSGFLTGS